VESDGSKAFLFSTCEEEYDDNWNPIVGEGGMFVMCIVLTNGESPSSIEHLSAGSSASCYDLQGRQTTGNGLQLMNSKAVFVK